MLKQYYNKKVEIIDAEGQTFFGTVTDYIFPEDNEPEVESIIIDTLDGETIEFTEKDIKTIEVIK